LEFKKALKGRNLEATGNARRTKAADEDRLTMIRRI